MKKIILCSFLLFVGAAYAKENKLVKKEVVSTTEGDQEIRYEYKKHEKFDFEDIQIEGESGAPGDLSILTRHQQEFQNRLPYRKNFNAEIRKSVERIR